MKTTYGLVAVVAVAATAAFAHSGVKNPAVKARMDSMGIIGANTKIIGEMAKGTAPFDGEAARAAAAVIAQEAGRIPALFEAPEQDPKSEALPVIWASYPEFVIRSQKLQVAARRAEEGISDLDSLRAALADIGKTCSSCHESYRE